MTLALELFRSVPRYVAARAVGERLPGLLAGPLAPIRLVNREEPALPAEGWGRVRPRLAGICGSDLATISGRSSFYFSPLVSMPFVPGHEVVGELMDDVEDLAVGTRVVIDPVLACAARGLAPCPSCAEGATGRCDRVTVGHVSPGLQTGYCADTGGGWSGMLVAHRSQLHRVPERMTDTRAVLVEPLACAIHAALRARPDPEATVLLVGAGTLGLLTLLALREFTDAGRVTVVAKHAKQRELAIGFGATDVVEPKAAVASLRRSSRAMKLSPERGMPYLLGGVDVAVDCVGSRSSLDLALRTTHAGVVPRAGAGGGLHQRGRTAPRRVHPAHVRPGAGPRGGRPAGGRGRGRVPAAEVAGGPGPRAGRGAPGNDEGGVRPARRGMRAMSRPSERTI